MEISAKELRMQPGKIIAQVMRGIEVVITFRGKRLVEMVPLGRSDGKKVDGTDELFGLWKNHQSNETVEDEVRTLRAGRPF